MSTRTRSTAILVKRLGGLLAGATLAAAGVVGADAVSATAAHAASCDTSWANTAASGAWNDPAHWTNGVPSSSSYACLPATATPYQVVLTGNHVYVGGIYLGSGSTLIVQSGPFTGGADVQVGSAGVDNEGGTLAFQNSGGYKAFFGIDNGNGQLVNNGTLTLNDTYFNGNVTNYQSATLEAQDSAAGNFSIVNTLTNYGTLVVDAAAELQPQDLASIDANGQLTGGRYLISGRLAIGNPQLVQRVFSNGANLDLNGAGQVTDNYGNNALALLGANNAGGTFALTNGAQLTLARSGFTSSGFALLAGASTLTAPGYVQAAGSTSLESASTITGSVNVTGGSLSGGGTVSGNLRNAGLVRLRDAGSAKLNVTGGYTQTSTGTVYTYVDNSAVTCAGRVQKSGCLAVHNAIKLAGTLDVDVVASPPPAAGTKYTLATTTKTTTGRFGHVVQVEGPLPGNLGVVPTFYGQKVILTTKSLG